MNFFKKMRLFSFLLLACVLLGCKEKKQSLADKQKQISIGKIDSANTYSVKEVGWTVQLPEGWTVLTKEELKKISEKGRKTIENTLGVSVDNSGLQELISIKKDRYNSFMSNMEKVDTTVGSYDERVTALNELMRTTYRNNKIKFEDQVAARRIDGIMFDVFDIKLLAPKDDKKVILYQSMYSAPINDYDFSMVINYNNEADKQILLNIIESSKFSIKN